MTSPIVQEEALKPCPFCGGGAQFEQVGSFAMQGGCAWSIGCGNEECLGFQSVTTYARKAEARTAWNTRLSSTSDLQDRCDTLAEALADARDSIHAVWCCEEFDPDEPEPPHEDSEDYAPVHCEECRDATAALNGDGTIGGGMDA